MRALINFHNNKTEREAVQAFQIQCLSEMAVEAAFKGESTEGFSIAKALISKSFDKLEELYGKIDQGQIGNSR